MTDETPDAHDETPDDDEYERPRDVDNEFADALILHLLDDAIALNRRLAETIDGRYERCDVVNDTLLTLRNTGHKLANFRHVAF